MGSGLERTLWAPGLERALEWTLWAPRLGGSGADSVGSQTEAGSGVDSVGSRTGAGSGADSWVQWLGRLWSGLLSSRLDQALEWTWVPVERALGSRTGGALELTLWAHGLERALELTLWVQWLEQALEWTLWVLTGSGSGVDSVSSWTGRAWSGSVSSWTGVGFGGLCEFLNWRGSVGSRTGGGSGAYSVGSRTGAGSGPLVAKQALPQLTVTVATYTLNEIVSYRVCVCTSMRTWQQSSKNSRFVYVCPFFKDLTYNSNLYVAKFQWNWKCVIYSLINYLIFIYLFWP